MSLLLTGTSSQEFVRVHVCFISCGMLPVSTFWSEGSSWVSPLCTLLASVFYCGHAATDFTAYIRKGQALQFNWLYEKGAFIKNPNDTFSVDFSKVSALGNFCLSVSMFGAYMFLNESYKFFFLF